MRNTLKKTFIISAVVLSIAMATQDAFADDPALTPQLMVLEGDLVEGVGNVYHINNLAINNNGDYLVEVDTDNPNTDIDYALLKNNVMILQEGQVLPAPTGALLDSFDTVNLNNSDNSGWNFYLDNTGGTNNDSGIYFNTDLVIQEGFISTATGFSANTPYIGFFECKINDADEILIMASVDDVEISSSVDRALVVIDPNTMVETVLIKEADFAPGTMAAIEDFETGPHNFDFNNEGDVMYCAELDASTTMDHAICFNDTLIAQEGTPSPISGRNWGYLASPELDINNHGDYVFHARLDGASDSDYVIIKNGQKFVQEGDSLPDIAPYMLTSLGTGPVLISDNGDVLWYGDWDDPNTDIDTGLFLNHRLIMQEGVTMVNGLVVDSIASGQDSKAMSNDGRYILVEVTLAGGLEAVVLFDRGPWEILGGELAGSIGTPVLRCNGLLEGNDPMTIDLSQANPLSLAHLAIGLSAVNMPFKGTTLVPYPDVIIFNLPTDANGSLWFTTLFPPGYPSNFEFWLQYFIMDASGPFGYAASNAVKGTTP